MVIKCVVLVRKDGQHRYIKIRDNKAYLTWEVSEKSSSVFGKEDDLDIFDKNNWLEVCHKELEDANFKENIYEIEYTLKQLNGYCRQLLSTKDLLEV